MGNKIKILVADDNREFANILREFLSRYNEFEIIGVAYDGNEAINLILDKKPDIAILDIIMPIVDGIGVIQRINESNLDKKPEYLILTAVSQERMTNKIINLGIADFMLKPFDLEILAQRIIEVASETNTNKVYETKPSYILNTNKSNNMEIEITKVMHTIGVPAHLKGHQYLREAILMTIKDNNVLGAITKQIYPDIAIKHKTTSIRVERAIRNAIETAWNRGKIDTLQNVFGYTINIGKGKPTNSEFIAMIADKISLEMNAIG